MTPDPNQQPPVDPTSAPLAQQQQQRRPVQASQAKFKDDYDRYVAKATMLIHAPETRESVLGLLRGDDPVQRVATATVMVMQRIDAASRAAGIEVQDSIKIFGAHEIVKMVDEVGDAAGIFKLTPDLEELALSVTVQDYVKSEVQAGRIDPQKLKVQMQADIRKMPPKDRKEIQQSQARIQQTARKYNFGKGMQTGQAGEPAPEPQPEPQGLINTAGQE